MPIPTMPRNWISRSNPRDWIEFQPSPPTRSRISRDFARVPLKKEEYMLHYAAIFFVIAVIAAIFGFTGLAVGAARLSRRGRTR